VVPQFLTADKVAASQTNVTSYQLGEERRDEGSGSRTVLPPRDLSEASRPQVIRDVPVLNRVDKVASPGTNMPAAKVKPKEAPIEEWPCQHSECQRTFPTHNKLFTHLREQLHFSKIIVPAYQTGPETAPPVVRLDHKLPVGTD